MEIDTSGDSAGAMNPSRLWPYAGVSFAVGVWLDLSRFHQMDHADAIVPVLTSLSAWTPYYWESNRFGMLVPLLATPFHNPLTNLLVQSALNLTALILSQFMIARYAMPHRAWPLCAALALGIFFVFASPLMTSDAAFQPWVLGTVLGAGGLILLEPLSGGQWPAGRIAGAALLFALAQWVNLAAVATLVPLAGMRFLLGSAAWRLRARELVAGAGLALLALLGSIQISIRAEHQNTFIGLVEPARWPGNAVTLGRNLIFYGIGSGDGVAHDGAAWLWAAIAAGLCGLALSAARARRGDVRLGAIGCCAIAAAALTFWLFLSTQSHIRENGFASRYVVPVCLMFILSLCCLIGPACARQLSERSQAILCACLLLAGATLGFGPPSLERVREDLTARWGRATSDLLALRATHVAGTYWSVWPAVWHANWMLYRTGEHRQLWGITARTVATKFLWAAWPPGDFRIAVGSDDLAAGHEWTSRYGLPPLRQDQRHGMMTLFVAQSPDVPAPIGPR